VLPLVLLVLVGCRGLDGTWTGDLLCLDDHRDTLDGTAMLILDARGGSRFAGQLRAEGTDSSTDGMQDMLLSWQLDLVAAAPTGQQGLDSTVSDCRLYLDGYLADETCIEPNQRWTWDGADGLSMSSYQCKADLSR